MSQLKQKTQAIVRAGEERRGSFTASGKPYELYMWWRQRTKQKIGRENFCHYWRVVAIWAPLMAFRMLLKWLFSRKLTWIILGLVATSLIVWAWLVYPGDVLSVLQIIGIVLYSVCGIVGGIALLDAEAREELFDEFPTFLVWLCIVVLSLVILPVVVIGLMVRPLSSRTAKRFYCWLKDARLIRGRVAPWTVPLILVYLLLVATGVMNDWWVLVATLIALPVIWIGGKAVLSRAGENIEDRRREKTEQENRDRNEQALRALDPVLRCIFTYHHPKAAHHEFAYQQWHKRYVHHVKNRGLMHIWPDALNGIFTHLPGYYYWPNVVDRHIATALQATANQGTIRASKPPTRLHRTLTGFGDGLVLLAQIIRVNKWKICPLVELPSK